MAPNSRGRSAIEMNETAGSRTFRQGGSGAAPRSLLELATICEPSLRRLRALILGARLAELRTTRNISCQELADRLGRPRSHVEMIERGNARNVEQVRAYVWALEGDIEFASEGADCAVNVIWC